MTHLPIVDDCHGCGVCCLQMGFPTFMLPAKPLTEVEIDADPELRQRAKEAFERAFYPEGVARQMAAAIAHGDRRSALQRLNIPSLAIHGTDDPLIPVSGGIDTHKNIPNSKLLLIEGMGHDMPVGAWQQIVDAVIDLTSRSQ